MSTTHELAGLSDAKTTFLTFYHLRRKPMDEKLRKMLGVKASPSDTGPGLEASA